MARGDAAPEVRIAALEAYQRAVPLRLPFRFGVVTLREVRQVFLRARVACPGAGEAWGWAAELMVPKWFDKDPARSNQENRNQLRGSLALACHFHGDGADPRTAFGHAQARARAFRRGELRPDPNGLVAGFGPSLVDRAVMDGVCRAFDRSFPRALQENLFGIDLGEALGDSGFDTAEFLRGLRLADAIHARHTIGLADALTEAEVGERVDDGLPESLEAAIRTYGHRYFKLKLSGAIEADLERLRGVARVLDTLPDDYFVTLDGNEQFAEIEAALELSEAIDREPALRRLRRGLLYLEQPLPRQRALDCDIGPLTHFAPVIADESDSGDDAFVRARACGYTGISSKTCKGVYRSLLNRARCALWNRDPGRRYFLCAEDLTTQPGLAVQQDLALASAVGCEHVERNGHHYANGMVNAPGGEMDAFAASHPDLYRRSEHGIHLRIEAGRISLASLGCTGFASGALPDPEAMQPMEL
jgi:hypothetical protein